MYIINALIPIGWPSVTTDFDSFVKEHLFFASEHNSVKVVIKYDIHQQQIESFPLPKACDTCNTLFRRSNIANIVGDIEWEHVVGSMFDPNCLVSLHCYKYKPGASYILL